MQTREILESTNDSFEYCAL